MGLSPSHRIGVPLGPMSDGAGVASTHSGGLLAPLVGALSATRLRIIHFGLVGLSGILVNLALTAAFTELLSLHYVASAVIATQGSTIWNFFLLDRWVFRDRPRSERTLRRFIFYAATNNAANALRAPSLWLLTSGLSLHYLISTLITLLALFIIRYALSSRLIWAGPSAPAEPTVPAPEETLPAESAAAAVPAAPAVLQPIAGPALAITPASAVFVSPKIRSRRIQRRFQHRFVARPRLAVAAGLVSGAGSIDLPSTASGVGPEPPPSDSSLLGTLIRAGIVAAVAVVLVWFQFNGISGPPERASFAELAAFNEQTPANEAPPAAVAALGAGVATPDPPAAVAALGPGVTTPDRPTPARVSSAPVPAPTAVTAAPATDTATETAPIATPTQPAPTQRLPLVTEPSIPQPVVEPFPGYALPGILLNWTDKFHYIVQPGDTLETIAVSFGTRASAIQGLNNLTNPSAIFAGEILIIPVGYDASVSLPDVHPAAALLSWPRVHEYTVEAGDTLDAVARRFFTTVPAIALFNAIAEAAPLQIGATLRVPTGFTLDLSGVTILFSP